MTHRRAGARAPRANEAVVLGDVERLRPRGSARHPGRAADDAEWRPHSSSQSVFHSTAAYRAYVDEAAARGVAVDSIRLGIWSHEDVVAVRGRLRVRGAAGCRTRGCTGCIGCATARSTRTASSPDLGRLLADAGLPGRANEAYMAMHSTEDVGLTALVDEIRAACARRRGARASTCGSSRRRSSPTRAALPGRRRRPAPDLDGRVRTSSAPPSRSRSTRSTSARAGSRPCASRAGLSGFRTVEAGLRAARPVDGGGAARDRRRRRSPRRSARTPSTS